MTSLAAWIFFVGDMPVRDLKRSHIKEFRNVIDQLPKNLQKGLSTNQALPQSPRTAAAPSRPR
jgi:hypothetical protein